MMKKFIKMSLHKSMQHFFDYPVSLVSTPAGFGKTTGVHTFLETVDTYSIYFSMNGEIDEEWAFKKIIQLLIIQFPDFNESNIHIPTSRRELDDFITKLHTHLDKPLCITFDDIVFSNIPIFMKMIRTYSFNPSNRIHFILITRDSFQEEIFLLNTNSYFTMDSTDFLLNKSEINKLCKLQSISLSAKDIDYVYTYANGWFIATQLLLQSYKKYNSFSKTQTVNNLIKEIFYNSLDSNVQISLLKLSILKDFTIDQAIHLCNDKNSIETIIQLETENYFIEFNYQKYSIVPILKDFLKKELLLSSIDTYELYTTAGFWYVHHSYPLDSINLFLQCENYIEILNVIQQYNDISLTDISPQLMTNVFSILPKKYKNEYPYVYLKWILDCITNLPWLNGVSLLEDFKQRLDAKQLIGDPDELLGEYYFIHAFTYYNDVKKMLDDFILSYNSFQGGHSKFAHLSMIATFGSYHVLYLYYNKVGELDNIVREIDANIHYFIHISQGINTGANEQVKAELAYETGNYIEVPSNAIIAYNKAIGKSQLSIAISSLFLQGRLALLQFNHQKFESVIQRLKKLYDDTNNPIIQCEIDCALSHLYILNNQESLIPYWLKQGDFENSYLLHEAGLITPIIHGLYLIKTKNYEKLDMIADIIENANIEQVHILAIIYAKLYKMISYYQHNLIEESIHCLEIIMQFCELDHVVSPIIELSFAFENLLDIYIPKNKFEESTIQESKKYLKSYHKSYDDVSLRGPVLTKKELLVLSMIAKNKILRDISLELNISPNTVQTHMKSIYRKLDINTKIEAIRYFEKISK